MDEKFPDKADLIKILDENGINHETDPAPVLEKSFTFKRELVYQAMGDDLKVQLNQLRLF
jgi:hypothetical protein